MAKSPSDPTPSQANRGEPKTRRKLTSFLCQEMLYDYATDRLDGERRSAVDEFLKQEGSGAGSCGEILSGIHKAIEYGETLATTQISTEMEARLKDSENVVTLTRRYSSFKEWPEFMRWAIVCVLLIVSVAAVVSAVPWARLTDLRQRRASSQTVEIAAIQTPTPAQTIAKTENGEADQQVQETSGDEEETGDSEDAEGSESDETAAKAVVKQKPSNSKSKAAAVAPVTPTQASSQATSQAPEEAADAGGQADGKPKGFVYRAFMNLANVEDEGPKITSDIEGLGGTKAGEVELGWKRGSGRYYHFALPEANEEKLLEKLRTYGPVRISKDPHSRVMPKGQVRFILWVESSGH